MIAPFNIQRDRWSIREIIMDEGDRPGRGGFAFVLDDEHFPYFQHPVSNHFAAALDRGVAGESSPPIILSKNGERVEVRPAAHEVSVITPAGVTRTLSVAEAQKLAKDLIAPLARTLASED